MNEYKIELRGRLRKEHQVLSTVEKNKSDGMIISRMVGQALFKSADRVFLYASVRNEINTHGLIADAYRMGKTVGLPKCNGFGIMDFYCYTGELVDGKFHIPEPSGAELLIPERTDIMIVPGLAFTCNGYRIGQGGGYYDRYLEKHPCVTIGLCRDRFILEEIPVEWNDLPVDYVITETAVYNCKNGASEEAPFVC